MSTQPAEHLVGKNAIHRLREAELLERLTRARLDKVDVAHGWEQQRADAESAVRQAEGDLYWFGKTIAKEEVETKHCRCRHHVQGKGSLAQG